MMLKLKAEDTFRLQFVNNAFLFEIILKAARSSLLCIKFKTIKINFYY